MADESKPDPNRAAGVGRRRFLAGAAAAVGCTIGAKKFYDYREGFWSADTFIAKADSYDAPLAELIGGGLRELGFGPARVKGRSVLLKPNLVEPAVDAPHINTHPAVVRAVAEVFRSFGAQEVLVGEGQGHCRDSYLVLEQSGVGTMIKEAGLPFVDLNHDEVFDVENALKLTSLKRLHLPATLKRADIVVSLPKLKTHHWAGVTLSMKNLFGTMPGIFYGWPKNVLHQNGIDQSILDVTATVAPDLAIVDGIIGMEGDGPIMGDPKKAGLIVMGANPVAVDATCCRLMGLSPDRIPYLAYASGRLGPISAANIGQRGEPLAPNIQHFALLEHPYFDRFRS